MKLAEIKRTIKKALELNDLNTIVSLAVEDGRTLNALLKFTYDKGSLETWRAIQAMGMAAKALLEKDYDFLRETTRRLIWSVTEESGGIGWSAPEMLGEIISADPDGFSDLIPVVASLYEEEIFRPGVMYALSEIAGKTPESVVPHLRLVMEALVDENPTLRVYALDIVRRLGLREAERAVKDMRNSKDEVVVYEAGDFVKTSVGDRARKVYDAIRI